ncbi:MAG: dihydropteroate synthase-like protein, partial [Sulfolobus sp.]|nr:dihydropteroate synthase-like protein [Sulfolobus sp.]
MKVLLVTGLFAAPIVENVVNQINENDLKVDIKVLNYPIAALMTTRYIAENLKGIKGYDYIIIPGLSIGDATDVEKTTGITTYKGTEDAYNIPILLKALKDGKSFSKVDAADKFLGVGREDIDNTLYNLEKTGIYAFEVGGVKIPVIPPPFRIFLEEDSSHFRGEEELQELQEIRKNVDVIVVGFPSGHEDVDEVKRYIKLFLDLGFPVGIDSGSPKELIEGIKAGASFVFNLNEINIDKLEVVKRDASFVVAPFSVENKAQITRDLIRKAKEKGFEKLIADVILSPPLMGITQSIIDYYDVKKAFPEIPMLMGFLNVTELIDADSVGINAILTAIAAELGIS